MDAGFHGTSTPHHSNTPQYHTQGHWPHPRNILQQLLSFLLFLHDCLTSKFLSILSHIFIPSLGEKTRPNNHKPKHSIDNTPAPNIVHIGTTPWSYSQRPPPSSQITKPFKIHHFRPVLPSSFCISLRPARRAVLSRRNPMSNDRFLHQHVRQIPQAGCTRPPMWPQQ